MSVLKLKQITDDGRTKSWKHSGSDELLTFGTSRKAKLSSIDKSVDSFESVLEYRNSEWHYITFSAKNEKMAADIVIKPDTVIQFRNSTLHFELVQKDLELITNIEAIKLNGQAVQQLVLVTKEKRIISVHVKAPKEKFSIYSDGKMLNLDLPLSDQWSRQDLNGYTIKYKKIDTNDVSLLKQAKNKEDDKESKTALIATLGVTFLLIAVSLLIPRTSNELPVLRPQEATMIIVKNDFKKKIPREKAAPKTAEQTPQANKPTAMGGKVSALLKGAIGVRISQLIGKVSATEARTANVLVTTSGAKAGETHTGRALAAIGKVESSGRNWNGESNGTGSGVSTAGVGGGNGSKGLSGGLGQGKTGAGGVGLIDEESEIIGGLDREVIAQYIKTQLGQILYCYERQLSANPNLYGKIAVKFTIAGTGSVETQSINDTTLKNLSVESCILSKISKWKFPEPKGGTKVLVTYPFLFKSTI